MQQQLYLYLLPTLFSLDEIQCVLWCGFNCKVLKEDFQDVIERDKEGRSPVFIIDSKCFDRSRKTSLWPSVAAGL